jgi:hypothetical protein
MAVSDNVWVIHLATEMLAMNGDMFVQDSILGVSFMLLLITKSFETYSKHRP